MQSVYSRSIQRVTKDFTIVFVDDDQELLHSLKLYMSMNDFDGGHFFSSWESAHTFFAKNSVDILILDISMPGCSGLHALKQVKAETSKVPVYMLSGINEVSLAVEALKLGAEDYFLKPLDWDMFIKNILTPLLNRKKNTELSSQERITQLKKWYSETTTPSIHSSRSDEYQRFCSKILKLLIEDGMLFQAGVTIRELADTLKSNTTTLSRFFNEEYKTTFPQWVKQMRIATFIFKIENNKYNNNFTIEGHGLELGFQSRSAFYTACKSIIGISPKQFLENDF